MNIIIIPFHDYKKWEKEGFRTRDAHMCQHFASNQRVDKILVINRPTSFAETVIKKSKWCISGGQVVYKKKSVQLSKMKEKVWCLDIFVPDFLRVVINQKSWWFIAFNYPKVKKSINEAIKYLGMEDNVLLLQNPMAIGSVQEIRKTKFVFDAIDNWLYHPQMPDKKLIKANYEFVDCNADAIMTVSESLKEVFPTNKRVNWIANGVDVDYFSGAIKKECTYKKTIGYVGKIQDRVDFDLVEFCLQQCPDDKFVFLGPVFSQKRRIQELQKRYSNVFFEGDVHYSELPMRMKEFDITLIPHKIDRFTDSMNPLKLYEYLAAGKPVVTTGVAGTESISKFVYVAESKDIFLQILKRTIKEVDNIDKQEIVDSVPIECRWVNRVDNMLSLIESL